MLTRVEALVLVKDNVSRENVVAHMLAVEAIMRYVAGDLNEDVELWGLVGLLHDLDYQKTEMEPARHTLVSESILKGKIPEDAVRAIKTHNSLHTTLTPESRMEKTLTAADAVSGLLIACALVMPSKKLADVKLKTVAGKFRDKDFARGADRKRILICEQIGIPLDKFLMWSLEALKHIAPEIGL